MEDMRRRKGIPGTGQKEKSMTCPGGQGAQHGWIREYKASGVVQQAWRKMLQKLDHILTG